jgi:Na+-transporting methylmalonyl-CoA/oxaloacetate decarboxylase gamma subunit
MEKMTVLFLIIIVIYLLYAFLKSKKENKIREPEKTEKTPSECREDKGVEKAVIAAVIAAVMGEAAFVIKRVYAVATVDEKKSNWRNAGRNELMSAKNTLK